MLLLCAGAVPAALLCLASNFYIFPDSNRRRLTEDEVWWQYDVLGYAFNELFARYGRPFIAGQKYDVYFRCQTWYQVDPHYPGDGPVLNNIEWANYRLIKDVRRRCAPFTPPTPAENPAPGV